DRDRAHGGAIPLRREEGAVLMRPQFPGSGMVENRLWADLVAHAVLVIGVAIVACPLYVTFVASTLTYDQIITVPMPLVPGDQLIENYSQVLRAGSNKGSAAPVSTMLFNSFVMAIGVALGKIAISILSAFAIVY